jgi:hypothetical protein
MMDVDARKGGDRIAIEIETGKSDVASNVKRDLLAGAQQVIVVATDEPALGKVEKQLANAALVIPGRVWVVLQDQGFEALL